MIARIRQLYKLLTWSVSLLLPGMNRSKNRPLDSWLLCSSNINFPTITGLLFILATCRKCEKFQIGTKKDEAMLYGILFVKFLVEINKISEIKSFLFLLFFQEYIVYRKIMLIFTSRSKEWASYFKCEVESDQWKKFNSDPFFRRN